jgi:NAD(P)-dependent dehydrogenase (short-subunit alcohol dehydrogenase family)
MNNNPVALVTGGARGIGFATAKYFGLKGFQVLFNDRDQIQGEKALQELMSLNVTAEFFLCNVANEEEVNTIFNKVADRYGYLDVLVNNAWELGGRQSFAEMSTEFWRNVLGSN